MNILSIDIGSYSVKFIESLFERKNLVHLHTRHVLVEDFLASQHTPAPELETAEAAATPPAAPAANAAAATPPPLEDIQQEIIKEHLRRSKFDGKIIYQFPSKNLTHRFLTLPVTGRKKAEMMIPFQLDKNLLFNSSEIKFSNQFLPNKNGLYSITSVTDMNQFETFYKRMETIETLPDYLTTEISVLQSYLQAHRFDGPCCFLDMGHETTKAYMVNNRKILSLHTSYIAGRIIDEIISETYQISRPEAASFKIKNGFFLTEKQYQEVDQDQQEFAKLMKQVIWPLVSDLKKWELGFRVNYGQSISNIYLFGGTSNIRNIANFFTQSLGIRTQLMTAFGAAHLENTAIDPGDKMSFVMCHLMGLSLTQKLPPMNFLTGNYANTYQEEIPLHSATFIGLRVVLVTCIIMFSLFVEKLFIYNRHKFYDQKITALMKDPELQISKLDQRRYKTDPGSILRKVSDRKKLVDDEIKYMQNAMRGGALPAFARLGDLLKINPDWEMTKFENRNGLCTGQFLAQNEGGLTQLKDQIRALPFRDLKVMEDPKSKTLTLEFKE